MLEQRREGVERRLVCLGVEADDADAFGGEAVFAEGSLVSRIAPPLLTVIRASRLEAICGPTGLAV